MVEKRKERQWSKYMPVNRKKDNEIPSKTIASAQATSIPIKVTFQDIAFA